MTPRIRPPAVAGQFYTANVVALRQQLTAYLAAVTPSALPPVRAVIAPHAGYDYSGPVAAFVYRLLSAQPPPQRVYLLGPAHRVWFSGVALADYGAFNTPLGDVPVDQAQNQVLARAGFTLLNSPHGLEHCLEVQLPFLQMIYPTLPLIVPLLFGESDPARMGELLANHLTATDLIIVSSDLSHYHTNEQAHTLDKQFVAAVLHGDMGSVAHGEACGQAPVLALMTIAAQRGWQPHLLDYRTSGDISGERRQVVGYAAIAYVEE